MGGSLPVELVKNGFSCVLTEKNVYFFRNRVL